MTIHHLNCGTLHPRGSMFGRLGPDLSICHVLLVERAEGLLLVDSGFGTGDIANPKRLGAPFKAMMRPTLDEAETAVHQVRARGYQPSDVRDIVVTHLDLDHAGGLSDFPEARIHVHATELAAALQPASKLERRRYISAQWAHEPRWVEHSDAGDDWFGFTSVHALDDDIVLIPLAGHTRGHSGVAVRDGERWLLHAGDSYFAAGEIASPPRYLPGLVGFQKLLAVDEAARRANQARLRQLKTSHPEVSIFSAHDPVELNAYATAS